MIEIKHLKYTFFILCYCTLSYAANTDLTIIHTSDLHAHLLPTNAAGQDCLVGSDCLGGFARLQSFIDTERTKNPNTIVLDAGDRFSGTPFYTFRKEADLIPLFQKLNMDALTVGNHEFDDPTITLESFLKAVTVPCILTNGTIPQNQYLKKRISSSVVFNKNGIKLGILGVLIENIKTTAMHGNEVKINPVFPALQAEIEHLKRQGINIIVLLSHLGLAADKELAEQLPDIDIIISGHSHQLLSNSISADGPYPIVIQHPDYTRTLIVSSGAFGRYVGKLQAQFNDQGEVLSFSGDTIPLSDKIPDHEQIARLIDQFSDDLNAHLNQKVQTLSQSLLMTDNKNYCVEECTIGQALSEMVLSQIPKADVVLINSGAIRSGFERGDILIRHILQAFPFDGTAIFTDMTGLELKNYIEMGLQKYHSGKRVNALLQCAGCHYDFDEETRKIKTLQINGYDIQVDKIYHIVLPLFLAEGGDNFPKLTRYYVLPKTFQEYVQESLKKKPYIFQNSFNIQKNIKQ